MPSNTVNTATETTEPTLDVVIPTYGDRGTLRETLSKLSFCEQPAALAKVIVVENGARHSAESVCGEFAGQLPLQYVHLKEAGLTGARNQGIRESSGGLVVFMDDDIRPSSKTLSAYWQAYEQYGDSRFYGGPVIPAYVAEPEEWLVPFLPSSAKPLTFGNVHRDMLKPKFLGGNFAVPYPLLIRFGMFEGPSATGKHAGGVGEETRLQQRMLDSGIPGLCVPDASVHHHVPVSECSQNYVKHRHWRYGFGDGQRDALNPEPQNMLFRVPQWYWRKCAQALSRLMWSKLAMKTREQQFRCSLQFEEMTGRIKGYMDK